MGVGARSGFGSHCALPGSTLGSIQAASAFGCLAKFVTLWWVWLLWCLSKEALGGCGSDPVWFLSVPVSRGLFPSGLFLPSAPLCLQTQAAVGMGLVLPRHQAPTWVGAFDQSPARSPARQWKLERWEGSVTCWWRLHWPFLGGQQLCPGSSIYSQVSGVPKRPLCEWDSVPWVVLSNGLAWCLQMYVMLASSLVVSIGLLFQEKLVSRITALIDLADDMGRRNKG